MDFLASENIEKIYYSSETAERELDLRLMSREPETFFLKMAR